jgi:hypothetical protein
MITVVAVLVAVAACNESMKKFSNSKTDAARSMTKQLAFEAYPQWSQTHTTKMCPDKIDELAEFVNEPHLADPWGHPYKMLCGPAAPPDAKGMLVVSLGEDGQDGTADDIKSTDK